jgi:hypothetical protein
MFFVSLCIVVTYYDPWPCAIVACCGSFPSPCVVTTSYGVLPSPSAIDAHCDLSFLTLHYYFVIPHHFEVLISPSFVLLLLVVFSCPSLYIADIFLLR